MFIILLCVLTTANEAELPYADEHVDEIPKVAPVEVEEKKPGLWFSDRLGLREVFVVLILIIYIIFYVTGKVRTKHSIDMVSRSMAGLRHYFYVVPSGFIRLSMNSYRMYVTGRSGYVGCMVSISMPRCCDPLGWTVDRMFGRKTNVVFEFICEPENENVAVFSLRRELAPHLRGYLLRERVIDGVGLKLFTDFGTARHEFVRIIQEFEHERPDTLVSIDMGDVGKYESSSMNGYVVRIEFTGTGAATSFVDDAIINFTVAISDVFNKVKITKGRAEKNTHIRAQLPKRPKEQK